MKTKHTPGPWGITQYTNYIGWSVYAKNRGCIAERWYDSEQKTPNRDELYANARLIAAAPELLEALECIVGSGDIGQPYLDIAIEAIAKAKGDI